MRGNEFWACEIDDERVRYTLQYSGQDVELFAKPKENDKVYSFLLPAEIMDRLAQVWQQWRKIDEPTDASSTT